MTDNNKGVEREGIREDLPYEDVSHRIGAIICHELNVARLEA